MRISAVPIVALGLLLLWPIQFHPGAADSNNDPATAERIEPGQVIHDGLNETSNQEDWFKVQAEMGKVLNVTLFTDDWPALDASLEVNDIWNLRQGFSNTTSRYECVMIVAPYTGDYYIRVYVWQGGGRYSLTAILQNPIPAGPGSVLTGELHNSTNHNSDIYRIYLDAGEVVSASLKEWPLPPLKEVSLDLYLMDLWPGGGFYTYLDISWWSDPEERVQGKAPHDGYYYIIATAFNGSGTYRLTVDVAPGAPGEDDFPPLARPVFSRAAFNGTVDQSLHHYSWYRLNLSFTTGQSLEVSVQLGPGWETGIFELFLLDGSLRTVVSYTNYLDNITMNRITLTEPIKNQGVYYVMLMAKRAVKPGHAEDLSDSNSAADFTITFDLPRENRPPYVAHPLAAVGTDEGVPLTLRPDEVFDDPDIPFGDFLRFSASGSLNLKVSGGTGPNLTITPTPYWSGREEVVLWAVDTLDARAELFVNITVNPVNDPPFINNTPVDRFFKEGESYLKFLNLSEVFSDPDLPFGDSLKFGVSSYPLILNIEPPGFLSSGPVSAPAGTYRVILRATDILGLQAEVYLNITVTRLPHPPRALAPSFPVEMDQDTEMTGPRVSELFVEPDGEPLTLRFRSLGRVNITVDDDGRLRLAAMYGWSGVEEVYVEAWDTEGLSASTTLVVTVRHVPRPPQILSFFPEEDFSAEEGTDITLRITATDEDLPNLTYEWRLNGAKVSSSSARGNALSLKQVGPGNHLITASARNSDGLEASRTWAVTIVARPVPPAVNATTVQTAGGAAAAVGIGAWLLVFFGVSEQGKYGFFKFLVIPLYTKIRREEVLDHFTRGRIYGMIESNPGVHYTLIRKKVGVGNGTLTYHLSTLEREGFIRSEWDGLYKRFYPAQMASPSGEAVLELSSVQRELLGHVRQNPGISQKELSALTGFSKRVVSYHITQMAQARAVRIERDGKKVRCFPVEEAT